MQADVHAVAMVQAPTRVQIGLSERRRRQGSFEFCEKEILDLGSVSEFPLARAFQGTGGCGRGRNGWLGIVNANDAIFIDESRDVAELVPVAVALGRHFVDYERAAFNEDERDCGCGRCWFLSSDADESAKQNE